MWTWEEGKMSERKSGIEGKSWVLAVGNVERERKKERRKEKKEREKRRKERKKEGKCGDVQQRRELGEVSGLVSVSRRESRLLEREGERRKLARTFFPGKL